MILARIPAKGEPSGASAVRGKFSIQAVDLNEFIEDASHEAAIAGSLTFADWEGAGEHSFPLDSGRSRFHYLRVDPDTGEAETIYNLEFGTPAGRRFLLAGRKYMQKDREGRFRGPGEVLEDYTTLFFRLHEIQGDGTAARGAGVLKFRTFEDLAAVRNLAEVLGGFRITGTNDPLLKLRARMRFLAFTASFVQHEYDPLSPDAGSLREDVQNEVLRGADTPDFFSTRPTADLHSVLRNTPALPLQALLNTGEVRIDFERRRIFRDSFWKGSFAADTLLGWEERVRNALLGSGAGQAGSIFAGGSFWKRFDSIEGTTARGQVVNYELSFLPGDPEVREVKYPDDNRRYFRKDDTILLLNYRNNPYRIVYDAIKVIDEQNAIGVMHLGKFPDGVEFATFVMARHNYPFEKMAVEDHRALFSHPRATIPDVQELSGEWTGHLVFLNRPNVSLLNQANPALLNATFTPASTTLGITYRLSLSGPAGLGPWSLDFTARKDGAALSAELRRIDADTLVGLWQVPELPPGRLVQLQDWLDVLRERPVFRFVLTRR
jgi:hypothetical protein